MVEAIFHRLCIRRQDGHGDPSMSRDELRLALGVTEALWCHLRRGQADQLPAGRVALGPDRLGG